MEHAYLKECLEGSLRAVLALAASKCAKASQITVTNENIYTNERGASQLRLATPRVTFQSRDTGYEASRKLQSHSKKGSGGRRNENFDSGGQAIALSRGHNAFGTSFSVGEDEKRVKARIEDDVTAKQSQSDIVASCKYRESQ
ncbi:hypothetical protein KM043_004571 [Ampulex compressa]|nr:hypothetical protein KM043_004571 [Ampulex compressa]